MRVPPDAQAAYDELATYTLLHGSPAFLHQHVVDAFAVQHAGPESKPIGVAFGLIGLYLHLERGLTGRQVQEVHGRLARRRRDWPHFEPPADRGEVTAVDVLAAAPGRERDAAIEHWCAAVWRAWRRSRADVMALVREAGEDGL